MGRKDKGGMETDNELLTFRVLLRLGGFVAVKAEWYQTTRAGDLHFYVGHGLFNPPVRSFAAGYWAEVTKI